MGAKPFQDHLKIALIHDYQPNLGGTTEVVIRLARALKRLGHSCKLVTHPESWVAEPDRENLELVRARMFKITFMQYVPHNSIKVAKIAALHRKHHIQLCHAHFALPYGLVAYLAKQISGVPYIITLHGSDVHTLASIALLKPVMRLCLENADAVTSVCEYLGVNAMRKLGIRKDIIVIPNFVNLRRYHKRPASGVLRREIGIPRGHPVVTHVSNFASVKNVLIIPDIAQLVLRRHPRAVFLMVGEPLGTEKFDLDKLKKKVAQFGLDGSFRFVGRRKDVPAILNLSDASVFPSFNEGAPLAMLESLAESVPTVASRVGGIPEIIRHGVNGYLVEKQRVEKYAQYICRLIEQPNLRRKMGRHGAALVREKYSEEVVVSQYVHLYEAVLKAAQSRQEQATGSVAETKSPETEGLP